MNNRTICWIGVVVFLGLAISACGANPYEVTPTPVVSATAMPAPPATTVPTQPAPPATTVPAPTPAPAAGCQPGSYFDQLTGLDAAEAIAVLDRDFIAEAGGQWSEGNIQLPSGGLVLWTDWLGSAPAGVSPLNSTSTQGGWGVWIVEGPFRIPSNNGGGRFLRVCQ